MYNVYISDDHYHTIPSSHDVHRFKAPGWQSSIIYYSFSASSVKTLQNIQVTQLIANGGPALSEYHDSRDQLIYNLL